MKGSFLIVSHVHHKKHAGKVYGYAPYVREMNLWISSFEEVVLIAPVEQNDTISPIQIAYEHHNLKVIPVQGLDLTSTKNILRSLWVLPRIAYLMYGAMKRSDHIHLRCPGNMGLLGCIVQMFFPKHQKTVKYAGNWDSNSGQPFTYRLQRKLLNNPSLFKNTKVLVYGHWPDSTGNIVPFFTASYFNREIEKIEKHIPSSGGPLQLMFVGSLIKEKNPLIALQAVQKLKDKNISLQMDFCGDGDQFKVLEEYVRTHDLGDSVKLRGNVPAGELKEYYKKAHFLIFLSESEGWPKVVAEAMFFGCVPITTPVSCVPEMLQHGERGDLIEKDLDMVADCISFYLENPMVYGQKSSKAMEWANQYTLELFEKEIKKII